MPQNTSSATTWPSQGGSYIRRPDGALERVEEPTREAPAPKPAGRRRGAETPADPETRSPDTRAEEA